jgi:hypothetical protein
VKTGKNGATIKQGVFPGANIENQMSISMNSNEEISFVTPVSNAENKSSNKNLINNLVKRGAVPNTKLIFEDNDYDQISSPVLGQRSSGTTSNFGHQNNPAIYEAFKSSLDSYHKSSHINYDISGLTESPEEEKT